MITQRIMAGLSYRQVADMCGTSIMMIEKTYWHLNDEIRLTSALADYRRRDDGTIEVIQEKMLYQNYESLDIVQKIGRRVLEKSEETALECSRTAGCHRGGGDF